jgi:2-dehydropantoate 2-reductase
MKIAVMGTGGVGGWFGAKLALSGEDVTFIARGEHLLAMREKGLKIFSPTGDMLVDPVKATSNPADIGPVDVVMFCVKLWDVDAAAEACRPMVGPDTAVISFQNGVDAEGRIAAILGPEHAVGGAAAIFALIAAPGVIRQTGELAWLKYGELNGEVTPRIQAFHDACTKAGINGTLSPDINVDIWEKFTVLAPLAGATASTRASIGPVLADPDTRKLFETLVEEAVAVGRAKGVNLADDIVTTRIAFAEGLPPGNRASMAADLERGNRLELEWLTGAVVRLGRELSLPVPVSETVYAVLKLHAAGHKG